jgi:hypothetical protein
MLLAPIRWECGAADLALSSVRRKVRTKPTCNVIGLLERKARHVTPARAAAGKSSCNVHVDMRNRLMGRNAVVLPHGDALGIEGAPNRSCSSYRGVHDGYSFLGGEVEQGHAMFDRDNEDVAEPSLLKRHQQRRDRAAFEDGVAPGA